MMLRDFGRSVVGGIQALKKGLPEVVLYAFVFFLLYTCLSVGEVTVSSQPTNLLAFAEAPAQQGGQETVAITGINHTAAYNPSQWNLVGSTTYVSGSVSDLAADDSNSAVFSSYNSGATNTTFNYSPNTSSDIDSNGNLGTQSNFTALSYGPDGITDTLTEGGTSGGDEQWSLPTGYQDPSSAWTSETLAYDNNTATASSSSIAAGNWSAYLVLDTGALTCGKIQYYVDHSEGQINQAQIDIYNGTWVNIYDGNGPWSKWSNVSFVSTSVTQMRIRFYNNHHSQSETAYIYEAQFLQNAVPQNYQLDLEAQWSGVNCTMANEWLCIYGGTMSTENLLVDVWNGSGWSNVIASISSGWNNLSVASYLVSSTFTIRFRDATPSDPTPNSWQVDVCLLHVWTSITQYTAEVEFAGSSDLNSWTSLVWLTDSSWNTGSVNVTIQVYNYTLGGYASSGAGYVNYISSTTASVDEGKTQAETSNPTSFRDFAGYWKIKIKAVKSTTQFQMKVDWIQFQETVVVQDRPPVAQFTESVRTVDTGTFVQFNASDSYDPDGTIVNYYWDFGDGQTGAGKVASHAFGDNGTYTVALTVTDNDGLTNTAQDTVVVQDRPPMAQFTKSANAVDTGVFVQFDASLSYDPDGAIVTYYWDFGDGKNITGKVASHSYADNGTYTVVLMVTDNDGLTGVNLDTILVRDKAPIASFTVSSITVYTDEIITFNATPSHDSDGRIVSYLWNFGDGTNATGIVVSNAYAQEGTYLVALTVTDDDGNTDSTFTTENVLNRATADQAPIAFFTVSAQTVYTGNAVTFNASSSYDPDGTITSYLWNLGDNFTTSGQTVTHTYADNGLYMVTLTVTDDDGTMNAKMALETVLNRAPIANFTVSSATAYTDEEVFFNASTSRDSDGTIISYFWDFDDGTNATGVVTTHSYDHNGTYTVKLTVTDDDDVTDFHAATESILNHAGPNQAPIAFFTVSAQTVYTGNAVTFNASSSYDPDGAIASYMWDFGDDFTTSGNIVDHAYGENGNFPVKLTVIDNDGSKMSINTTVVVLDRLPYASFTWSTSIADREETIYFNASMSYDPDGTITTYFWDFGDQTNATGVAVNHKYVQYGNYTVTLTVTDNDASSNATSIDETIINSSTIASFTILPTQPSPGDLITFNASSSHDQNGTIERYMWDFGDGNITETSTSTITHSYTLHGDFNVTLTIFNTRGHNASASQRISVQIHNVAIIDISLSSTETEIGQTVNIAVKAQNKGTAPESFNITVLRNETVIASELVSDLSPQAERVLVFYWNTSSVQNSCKFLIQAKAENVTGETALADNSYVGGIVSLFQTQDNGTSRLDFDWKWALLITPAAVLLPAGFIWRRRNGTKKFRSFKYFDEITSGGIPDSFSVLIVGGPGSGKSILCQELAHSFLTQKKSCLYVTYDCFPDEVRDNLGKFHNEISTYEAEKKLLFMDCFSATSKNKDKEYYLGQSFSLPDLGIVLSEATSDLGPSPKIVLDSITPLITHIDPLKVIEFLQDRGARIKGVSGTFIFTIGKATIEPSLANRLEETVDCIIELDESTNKGKTVRRLHVKKMRGKKTSDKWIRFEIEPKKGIMFPT